MSRWKVTSPALKRAFQTNVPSQAVLKRVELTRAGHKCTVWVRSGSHWTRVKVYPPNVLKPTARQLSLLQST